MNVTENKINQSVCDAAKIVRGNLRVIVIKRKDLKSLSHLPKETKDLYIRSDQISCSVVSDSLRLHDSQHARPPCPSSTPGVHSDSRLSSQ